MIKKAADETGLFVFSPEKNQVFVDSSENSEDSSEDENNTMIEISDTFKILKELKKQKLKPQPEYFEEFLNTFYNIYNESQASATNITLKEVQKLIANKLRISKNTLHNFMRALKFSGKIKPIEGEDYVTYNLPFIIDGTIEDLKKGIYKAYIKAIGKIKPITEDNLSTVSTIIFANKNKGYESYVLSLLKELEEENEFSHIEGKWCYNKRKIENNFL